MGDELQAKIDRLVEEREIARVALERAASAHAVADRAFRDANEAMLVAKEEQHRLAAPPVDRSARIVSGEAIAPGVANTEDRGDGQQKGYVLLSEEERRKGFVRRVRKTYRHLKCGATTTMSIGLAETYARDPKFYSGTFCCGCGAHFPVGAEGEFVWDGTDERVGT